MNEAHSLTADELRALDMASGQLFGRCADLSARQTACWKSRSKQSISSRACSAIWGTVPGINFIYAHLNPLIRQTEQSVLLVTGPGHGAPANLVNLYLEGTLACANRAGTYRTSIF